MLNKFLKSSVSAFVLLGALSIFDSSYAMEGQEREDQKKSRPHFTFTAVQQYLKIEEVEGYTLTNKQDLDAFFQLAKLYRDADQHSKAILILEDMLSQVGEHSFRFPILYYIAKSIVLSRDASKFAQADDYLNILLERPFSVDPNDWWPEAEQQLVRLTPPFTWINATGEEKSLVSWSSLSDASITKNEILALKKKLLELSALSQAPANDSILDGKGKEKAVSEAFSPDRKGKKKNKRKTKAKRSNKRV